MRLPVRAPFHLEATVRLLQRRPSNLIDHWEDQRYRRLAPIHGRLALLELENVGTVDAPDVRLRVTGDGAALRPGAEEARIVSGILGLDLEPAGPQKRAEAEPALRDVARALRGMRPPRYPDLFETVASVIPFQQVSLDAGMAVVSRLVQRFGERREIGGRLYHRFPSAETIAACRASSLRRCGMSARKSETLRAAAAAIAAGHLTAEALSRRSSAEAIDQLTQLSGIGPWSAALILLRGLRRLDVFPSADTGAEGSLATLLRLRSRASLAPIVERFGELRGYLYFYGLASRLLARGLIRPAASPDAAHGADETHRAAVTGRTSTPRS